MKKKVVAFVPIKLNSKRLPHKNILKIGDKPLCYYIFEALKKVNGIDEIYVFCSDETIKDYIPQGIKFLKRDSYLDGDLIKGYDIYKSFTDMVEADVYILAHTTSPFLKSSTIENALSNILKNGYDSSFSAQKIQTFAWYKGKTINYDLENIPRTQDIEPIYIETSGFFMFEKEIFKRYKRRIGFNPYIQVVDTIEAIDIDTKEDYDFACTLEKNLNI